MTVKLTSTSGHKPPLIKPMAAEKTRILTKVRTSLYPALIHVTLTILTGMRIDGNANVPFNTQFFQDDYDDGPGFDGPGFDDDGDGLPQGVDDDEQDLLASTQKRRRVRPEAVSYAKRAKRVDVRKLKDNIWKGLDIVVPHIKENDNEEKDEDEMVRFTCIPLSCLKTDASMKGR